MAKSFQFYFLACSIIALTFFSGAINTGATDDKLKDIVDNYLSARQATMLLESIPSDIDKLLDFYTDSVIYEHPRFKMKIEGKTKIREGMLAFLGATKDTKIINLNYITGINLVVSEHKLTYKSKKGNSWEEMSRTQVTLFEFNGDKISRVVDYW